MDAGKRSRKSTGWRGVKEVGTAPALRIGHLASKGKCALLKWASTDCDGDYAVCYTIVVGPSHIEWVGMQKLVHN